MIRLDPLLFLSHDCRRLGMLEWLQGLQTPPAVIHPCVRPAGRQVLVRLQRKESKGMI